MTIHHEEFMDSAGIEELNGTEISGTEITLSPASPVELFRETSDKLSTSDTVGFRRNVIINGTDVYILYSMKSGINVQLLIRHSNDQGNNWSDPIEVWKGKKDGVISDLNIWNGTIVIAFVPFNEGSLNKNDLFTIMAPSNNITLFGSVSPEELVTGWVSDFEIAVGIDHLYIAVKESNRENCVFYSYNGNIWDQGVTVVNDSGCDDFHIDVYHEEPGDSEMIIISYSDIGEGNGQNRTIHLISSTDNGEVFTDNTIIGPIRENATLHESIVFNDRVILITGEKNSRSIRSYYHFLDGSNGSYYDMDLDIGSGSPEPEGIKDLSVGEWNDRLVIAYRNDQDVVFNLISDRMGTFNGSSSPLEPLGESVFSGLSLTSDGNKILFCDLDNNVESLTLIEIGTSRSNGTMKTSEFSPPMLDEWKEVCFNATIPEGTGISLRLMDGVTGEVIHPENAWINASRMDQGLIEGDVFTHILKFEPDWLRSDSISVEFLLEGDLINTPTLDRIALNYSTEKHYDDDLSNLLQIDYTDAHWESGHLRMLEGVHKHTIETEPLEKEKGAWPDHISIEVSNVANGDQVFIGLRDPENGETIPGFSEDVCIMRDGLKDDGVLIPLWNGSILGSLSEEIGSIKLSITLISGLGSGSLTVERIRTIDDREPSVLDHRILPDKQVLRNSTLNIEVELEDDIQNPEDLLVEIDYMLPQGSRYEDHLAGPGQFIDDRWTFNIQIPKSAPLGECDIRLTILDMNPLREPLYFNMESVKILNNEPSPPEIAVSVIDPTTTDDIIVEIIDPGTDIETSTENIRFNFEWWLNDGLFRSDENKTDRVSVLDHDHTEKGQDWKVIIWSSDGLNRSTTLERTFTIKNSAPIRTEELSTGISLGEDQEGYFIDMDTLFKDHDEDRIMYNLLPGDNISISMEGNIVKLIPEVNWNGNTEIKVQAFDGQAKENHTIPVTVTHINDPPESVSIDNPSNGSIGVEGSSWNFSGSYFDPDEIYGQTVSCSWEINGKKIGTGRSIFNIILQPGIHNVTFNVTDEENHNSFSSVFIRVNETIKTVENETIENVDETNSTFVPIDHPDEKKRSVDFCFFSIFGASLIVIIIGSTGLLIKRHHEKEPEDKGSMQAPPSSEVEVHEDDELLETIETDFTDTPELPAKGHEDGQSNQKFFNGNRKKKIVRTCLSSNGNPVQDRRQRSSMSFSPYRFYSKPSGKNAERIAENDSYYIRPAFPYQKP